VLGYTETVRDLTRDRMHAYFAERYAPDNMILFVAGNVRPHEIFKEAQRLTAHWAPGARKPPRRPAPLRPGSSVKQVERFNQQEVALVFPSAGAQHPLDETAEAVASILGGGNSRIFWNVVQSGLSPRAGAWRMDYQDFGLMILSGLCEPENCERLTDALRKEALAFTTAGPDADEVQRVKQKRRTSLAVEAEAPYYRLVQLMEDVDTFGEPRSIEQRLAAVDAVSIDSVRTYLSSFPIDRAEHLVSVGPREWPAPAA
jgi:predicted Zn-dependent peptidase